MTPARKRLHPIIFVPGVLFWALIAVGFATDNDALLGAAACVFAVSFGIVAIRAIRRSSARRAEQQRIWREGNPARASVVTIANTGSTFNDHPYVDLELDVDLDGRPYRASVRALISMLAVPRIQPSCEIAVHVDPADRQRLVIDPGLTPYGYGA